MLLNKERKYLISQFPKIKPFYEKTLHNKVDVKNRFYVVIPTGKKFFIWFTYLNGRPVCVSLNYLFKTKNIQHIKIIPCNFDPILCSGIGTILYGTHVLLQGNNIFSVENIFYYKNKRILFESQYNKLNLICRILNQHLSHNIYLKQEYLFKLPIINDSHKSILSKLDKLPYNIYCIQHRSWTENIYLNEKITVRKIHYAVFSISSERQTDIYTLFCDNKGDLENVGYAYVGNIKTSKFMNKLFRRIRENDDIDLIEESEDEDTFENTSDDKFILNKTHNIRCVYNKKFKKWEPLKLTEEPVTKKEELIFLEK
jgi:hypothetical protein